MSFTEVEFFFFFPVAVFLHWILPRSRVVQNVYLLTISLVFYACWSPRLLVLLVVGGVVDFCVVRFLACRTQTDATGVRARKAALTASLAFSLGALAYF